MAPDAPQTPAGDRPLDGRVAVVSGGASGIGRATAERLAAEGAEVVVADLCRAPEQSERLRSICVDLREPSAIEALRAAVEHRLGPVDILVSSAGRGLHERLAEGDPAKWEDVFATNTMGAARLARAFLPAMLDSGDGDVVFVSSVAAGQAFEWGGVYGASKAALEQLAETLRLEVQPDLRVTTVAPGVVETDFFANSIGPAPGPQDLEWRALDPGDVADTILYALSRPDGVAVNRLVVRPADQPF